MTAEIHSLESMAAVDGDGLRYAVFFAGCPLRCVCCHNPDTWASRGKPVESRTLYEKLRRYKPYFGGGGGVTFSGGEPLLHAAFINETAGFLRNDGIGYALDTSGAVPVTDGVKTAVKKADLVILDIKYPDAETYARYTGGDFDTFLGFAEFVSTAGGRVWYRTVIIPGINDSEEMLSRYVKLVSRWRRPEKYELLAFHTMGFYKYGELGINNPLEGVKPLDGEKRDSLQNTLNRLVDGCFRAC